MAAPSDNTVPLTNDPFKDGLLQGSSWQFGSGPHILTYSFSIDDTLPVTWSPSLQNAFVQALTAWSNVANLTFVETGSGTVFTDSTADIAADLTGSQLQATGAVGLGIFPDPAVAMTG